jgi:hypothetical protein
MAYALRKTMMKTFAAWYKYKENKIESTHKKVHAQALYCHRNLVLAFACLKLYQVKESRLQKATILIKKLQIKLYAPARLAQWRHRLNQRQKLRSQRYTAEEFD